MDLNQLQRRLFAPVDIASIVVFRVLFGAIMLWEVYRYAEGGRIARYYIEPVFHFKYYGFGWAAPWPELGMYLHFGALGLLGAGMTTIDGDPPGVVNRPLCNRRWQPG